MIQRWMKISLLGCNALKSGTSRHQEECSSNLMMEAVGFSKPMLLPTPLLCITSQKTAIFILTTES
jgi:hypothetical protein